MQHSDRGVTFVDGTTAPAPNPGASPDVRSERVPLRRVELLVIFAFWTFIALLTAANGLLDPRGRGLLQPVLPSAPVALAFVESYLWAVLTPLIFWLSSRFSIERSNWVSRVLLFLGLGVLVAIFVDVIVSFLRFEVFYIPRRRMPGLRPLWGEHVGRAASPRGRDRAMRVGWLVRARWRQIRP